MSGPPAIEGNGGHTRGIQFNLAPIYKNTVVITMWLGWDDWINLIAHIIAPFQKSFYNREYITQSFHLKGYIYKKMRILHKNLTF
jgi:hypothetical protein